jgi:hypothetical protein
MRFHLKERKIYQSRDQSQQLILFIFEGMQRRRAIEATSPAVFCGGSGGLEQSAGSYFPAPS